jgi:nucleotide-binding universal stress UspA family protein
MSERVIVAVDGGEASGAAVRWVAQRANSIPMDVTLLTITDTSWLVADEAGASYRDRYDEALEEAAATLAGSAGNVSITRGMRHGSPVDELFAASREADLLVVGTHRAGPITGLVHGGNLESVAERAHCVSVVVPATWRHSGAGVVVGWNADSTSNGALDFAAREASSRGCSLTIVRAAEKHSHVGADSTAATGGSDAAIEQQRRELASAAERLRFQHPGLEIRDVLAAKHATHALAEAAAGAEVVVVGSHTRGPIGGLFLGSVSRDILHTLPAPVAVVPHREEPVAVTPELADQLLR